MRRVTLALLLLALVAGIGHAQGGADANITAMMETLKEDLALTLDGEQVIIVRFLPEVYAANGNALIWTDPATVGRLLANLEDIVDDGLVPADYHGPALSVLGAIMPGDPVTAARRDVLLTDAYVTVLYHLSFGKADPNRLDQDWNLNDLFEESDLTSDESQREIATEILASVATGDLDRLFDMARPALPIYRNLRDGHRFYRGLAEAGGWPVVPDGPTLREGDEDPRVAVIRRRLVLTGDFNGMESASETFDADLTAAVTTFQGRHGLAADGLVGKGTVAALNVSADRRVDQIRVNLERARWAMNLDVGGDLVLVNIASYQVWLLQDHARIWHARVQVGKPFTRTPVFADAITYLEFNPNWTVPASIANRSYLAKVKADPGFLASKDMVLLDSKGREVDPATVDWGPVTRMPYTMRQKPGPQNALGQVKFIFPNKHAVYLHDTPSRQHFGRDARAFSSGCIRVENPLVLAALMLDDQPGWTRAHIDEVIAGGERTTVTLTEPLPVILLYWTAYSLDPGVVRFREDLYERDTAVLEALDGPVVAQSRHQRESDR